MARVTISDSGLRFCAGCLAPITPGPRERNPRRWCSNACRVATHRRRRPGYEQRLRHERGLSCRVGYQDCVECGQLFTRTARGRRPAAPLCGLACQRAMRARLGREAYAANDELRRYRRQLRESWTPEQRARRRAQERAAGYRPSKRAADQRRRARKAGATVETFDPLEVFERDHWTCGICAEPIDSALRYPNPRSPSLDHLIPLSLGGAHSRANTRASHLECNMRRGNRLEDDALLQNLPDTGM